MKHVHVCFEAQLVSQPGDSFASATITALMLNALSGKAIRIFKIDMCIYHLGVDAIGCITDNAGLTAVIEAEPQNTDLLNVVDPPLTKAVYLNGVEKIDGILFRSFGGLEVFTNMFNNSIVGGTSQTLIGNIEYLEEGY